MSSTNSSGESAERESRGLCCQSFWCGEDRAHSLNLSHGGMCFRISRRAEPGETVELHLGPQLRVYARIAWTRLLANCTEIGVEFSDTPKRVEAWVENLCRAEEREQSGAAEPILALPAPEHSSSGFQLSQIQLNGNSAMRRSAPLGGTWQTAWRISQ